MVVVQHLRDGDLEHQLAKVEQLREPPAPVWVRLMLDEPERAGVLYGWAANPNGADDGWRGLVLAPREFAPGFWTEFLGWVRAEHIRQRSLGTVLVDGRGRTVYVFANDAPDKSNCDRGCAVDWPPYRRRRRRRPRYPG